VANEILGIDHIGIAVEKIEENLALYKDVIGLEYVGTEEVTDQKINAGVLKAGDTVIELIEPITEDSPVRKFLDKKGPGVHHIAIGVKDIDSVIKGLLDAGVKMIDEKARPGAHNRMIAFLHPKSTGGILLEICEHS